MALLACLCIHNNAARLCCSTVTPSCTRFFKGERGFIKEPHCQKQKTARTVAPVALYLSGIIHKAESDSVTLYYVTWSNVKPLIFHHRTDRNREMEGVCNASTALDCSDSTRAVLWAVILYICTLDFIAKWRLLSWNSFGSLQIYHRLSQTQTAAWKWGARTDALYIVGRACRRCYFSPLQKKKKIEELWSDTRSLRAWKFNLCVKCLIYRGPQSLVFFVVCL